MDYKYSINEIIDLQKIINGMTKKQLTDRISVLYDGLMKKDVALRLEVNYNSYRNYFKNTLHIKPSFELVCKICKDKNITIYQFIEEGFSNVKIK